ncbi:MAG: IS1634 family transposase [Bacteroidales bacterium]|nr:IS1634 family transposase [Bacteroidales bacterium]
MFVRKKRNPSGIVSVQVIDKSQGKYRVLKTIGSSSDIAVIESLYREGVQWIADYTGQLDIFDNYYKEIEEEQVVTHLFSNIENILLNGTQLILDRVFNLIGFDHIEDDIFRHLVVARISQPLSKAATVEYLKSYFDEDVKLHNIYRYLDTLHSSQQELVQQISVEHTKKILGGSISLVFYDVTTLYFETDEEDSFRERGWSKDGKHNHPQIVLGLLVSRDGYPLAYSLFNGSQFEGRTMIPIIEDFVKKFDLKDFVVVADSGLMNKKNISFLESTNYKYIIGARIKNESDEIKQWIFSLKKQDGVFYERKKDTTRLIVGYSEKRAKKDSYNRNKGIKRLEKDYQSGKISKENINKRGYNKFLKLSNTVNVVIDRDKIKEDEQWDGLKGYITNTSLSANEVYKQYSGLWVIERAYRVTKGTLEMRPMFHFTPKRIEAHVCICFVAYKVYKELERILKASNINLSVDKVLSIAKTITTIKVRLPKSNKTLTRTMLLTERHKLIASLFDENFWENF